MRSKSLPTDQLRCSKGMPSNLALTATGRTNGESNIPINFILRASWWGRPSYSQLFALSTCHSTGLDGDFRLDGVGDVTGLVRAVMEVVELGRRRRSLSPRDLRTQRHLEHGHGALR